MRAIIIPLVLAVAMISQVQGDDKATMPDTPEQIAAKFGHSSPIPTAAATRDNP